MVDSGIWGFFNSIEVGLCFFVKCLMWICSDRYKEMFICCEKLYKGFFFLFLWGLLFLLLFIIGLVLFFYLIFWFVFFIDC